MAKSTQHTSKVHIDLTDKGTLDPDFLNKIVIQATDIAKTKISRITDDIRDDAKKKYSEMIHRTTYGTYAQVPKGSSKSLAEWGLVKHKIADFQYSVGAKSGATITTFRGGSPTQTSLEEIFNYIEEGTGDQGKGTGKKWRFKLPTTAGRNYASSNGYWTTSGQAAKPFMESTYNEYRDVKFDIAIEKYISPDIDKMLRGL